MNKQESIHHWFSLLEQRGEYVNFPMELRPWEDSSQASPVQSFELNHADFDGVTAYQEAFRRFGLGNGQIEWKIPFRKKPSELFIAFQFLRYLWTLPYRAARWERRLDEGFARTSGARTPIARAVGVFTAEETQTLSIRCKQKGVHPDVWILHCLQTCIEPYLAPRGRRIWMVPTSLRDHPIDQPLPGNFTGFFDLFLPRNADSESIQRQWKKKVLSGISYGGYAGVSIGRWIGLRMMSFLVSINDHLQVRTGAFSCLGNMGLRDQSSPLPSHCITSFVPVIGAQPISVLSLRFCGRQVLTLQIHPSICESREATEALMSRWKTEILR